jgi:hypothetical protein
MSWIKSFVNRWLFRSPIVPGNRLRNLIARRRNSVYAKARDMGVACGWHILATGTTGSVERISVKVRMQVRRDSAKS